MQDWQVIMPLNRIHPVQWLANVSSSSGRFSVMVHKFNNNILIRKNSDIVYIKTNKPTAFDGKLFMIENDILVYKYA